MDEPGYSDHDMELLWALYKNECEADGLEPLESGFSAFIERYEDRMRDKKLGGEYEGQTD